MSYTVRLIAGFPAVLRCCLLTALLLLAVPDSARASVPAYIQRIDVRPKASYTRVTVKLSSSPKITVSRGSGNRLSVYFHETEGALHKPLRRYTDKFIGGIRLTHRGPDMLLTIPARSAAVGWRTVQIEGVPAVSFDLGPALGQSLKQSALPGRERIRAGAEKLLSNFDPPIKPEIPFEPTDKQSLKTVLNEENQKIFLAAEGLLYKGKLTNAEELFASFAASKPEIRPLALYRLGESQYRLQKYSQALETFREAVRLWQEFLTLNPAIMFYYGDSIARNGDLPGGRGMLSRLVVANSDKMYAPVLLVRMADVLARQGRESDALAIYKTVADAFATNKAHHIARIKLADRAFLAATPDNYRVLSNSYVDIAGKTTDFDLREEAVFKNAMLESINGPPEKALDLIIAYQKRYPKGVYSTVVRDIREDLASLVFKEGSWGKNPAGLIRLVTDNQEYLAATVKNPEFLPAVTVAFDKAGRPLDMIVLYAALLDRPWIGDKNAAYLTLQIADQAELLGDAVMARKTLQSFLLRGGDLNQTRWARERLAAIQYASGEMAAVRSNLLWVLAKDQKASLPLSYYYLGRALWDAKDYRQSALAMELYLAVNRGAKVQPPLISDAYYVAANARNSLGDKKAAEQLLESGLKLIPAERRDQFLYRLGEIALSDGRIKQATAYYERIIKEGKDPDWQRMARQSLEEVKRVTPISAVSKR